MTAVVVGAGTLVTTAAAVPHALDARPTASSLAGAAAADTAPPPAAGSAAADDVVDRTVPRPASSRPPAAPARASRAQVRKPLAPREIAKAMLAGRGWSRQFDCLDSLWRKESNWRVNADNPSSSAHGIPQALPGSKMSSAGADWRTNPATQIRWGLGYIANRYGTPCAAWAHSRAYNYY